MRSDQVSRWHELEASWVKEGFKGTKEALAIQVSQPLLPGKVRNDAPLCRMTSKETGLKVGEK